MAKTYTKDQIRRMREANAAINRLEAAKHNARPSEIYAINEAIKRWRTTLAFIMEECAPKSEKD